MSKSLGTGVDPMGVIETLGADVLRYTLLSQTGENQDIRYSDRKNEESRNFANKIWNATRFVLMNVSGEVERPESLETIDKWLLSRLAATEVSVREGYSTFDIQSVCQALYRFFWGDVCDWYIEVSKSRLADPSERATPQWVLLTAFEAFLKMLHPVMPHLTEELYSYLPLSGKAPFLMSASWPSGLGAFVDAESEGRIERVFEAVRTLRALRAGLDIAAMRPIPVAYYEGDLGAEAAVLRSQAWVEDLRVGKPIGERFVSATSGGIDVHLPIGGLVDLDKMLAGLDREEAKTKDERTKLAARLENPQFVERAKPEVIERDRAALAELDAKLEKLVERRALFA